MNKTLLKRLKKEIDTIPVIDLHCHLRIDTPNAQNLGEILFYHFVCMEFAASGVDVWSDLPRFGEGLPEEEKIKKIIAQYIPYLENIQNTTTYWSLQRIFEDIYHFDFRHVNSHNWKLLYEKVLSTAFDDQWTEEVLLKKAKVESVVPTVSDLEAFKGMNKKWIKKGLFSPSFEGSILHQIKDDLISGDSIREALRKFFQRCRESEIMSVTGGKMSKFIKVQKGEEENLREKCLRGNSISPDDENTFSNMFLEMANEVEFSWITAFGMDLPFKGKIGQNLISIDHNTVPELCKALHEYTKVRVFIYAPAYALSQEVCTAARMIPNIYPMGFQWHGFFFPYIERMIEDRLATLPMNKPIGFMSDAYYTEWLYGKLCVVRFALAKVLSQKVEEGLYTEECAIRIARRWLYDNPKESYFGGG